jgi:hypothetical protein
MSTPLRYVVVKHLVIIIAFRPCLDLKRNLIHHISMFPFVDVIVRFLNKSTIRVLALGLSTSRRAL